jgi:hypothetical protein
MVRSFCAAIQTVATTQIDLADNSLIDQSVVIALAYYSNELMPHDSSEVGTVSVQDLSIRATESG